MLTQEVEPAGPSCGAGTEDEAVTGPSGEVQSLLQLVQKILFLYRNKHF